MPEFQPSREFAELLANILDGEVDATQWQRFSTILKDDALAREYYYEALQLHAWIRWERHQPQPAQFSLLEAAGKSVRDAACARQKSTLPLIVYRFFAQPTPLSMSVAALVIGLLVTVMAFMAPPFYRAITRGGSERAEHEIVAEITKVHEADWASGQLGAFRGAHLIAGRQLRLEAGLVEVTFRDGAIAIIEGPAVFRIDSKSSSTLDRGKLAARVGEEARGFKVHTEHATITDLGTEFGVEIHDETTSVAIYEGEVRVAFVDDRGGQRSVRATAGGLVKVDRAGQLTASKRGAESHDIVRRIPSSADAGAVSFREDFSDSATGFTFTERGDWSIAEGKLRNTASGMGRISAAAIQVGHVRRAGVRMTTKFSGSALAGNSDVGFAAFADSSSFCLGGNNDYYLADFKADGTMRLLRIDSGDVEGAFTFRTIGTGRFSFSTNETYELIFEAQPIASGGLALSMTIVDPSAAAPTTIAGVDPVPLTGGYFGYRTRVDPGLGNSDTLAVEFDEFRLSTKAASEPSNGGERRAP